MCIGVERLGPHEGGEGELGSICHDVKRMRRVARVGLEMIEVQVMLAFEVSCSAMATIGARCRSLGSRPNGLEKLV